MLRKLLVLVGGLVAAGAIAGPAAAFGAAPESAFRNEASSAGRAGWCDARTQGAPICRHFGATEDAAARRPARSADSELHFETRSQPVPSLTPAATQRLWSELVRRPRVLALRSADCSPLRAVFYAPTDWRRLATKLAVNPSPCAQYYVSVPPVGDKTQQRGDEAWRIRALGPSFHALAEISVNGWTEWVASTGRSWYEAGVEARRRMAAAGYDVTLGDTWALNELSSAVRQGTGDARANMRAFLNGLHDGDGSLPAVRGTVFIAGIGQATTDLSLYQARLQDWYEDSAFWSDVARFVADWSQEVYGDVRHYAVPGATREARRDLLNEYLRHQTALAAAAPAAADAARAFLSAASSPLANAAWRYDAAFGWTDVTAELMQDYVSAQTYALRAAGAGRFGYVWSPKNLAGVPTSDFNAQTDALLTRLAVVNRRLGRHSRRPPAAQASARAASTAPPRRRPGAPSPPGSLPGLRSSRRSRRSRLARSPRR